MISSGWVAVGISVAIAGCGIVASWAVVQYKVNRSEERDKAFTEALGKLDAAIRDVGKEIKGLLFNVHDAGRPFYQRADDCMNHRRECAEEIEERLTTLEAKAHTHEGQRLSS